MPFKTKTSYLHSPLLPTALINTLFDGALEPTAISLTSADSSLIVRLDLSAWLLPEVSELVPSFCGLFAGDYGYQCTLSITTKRGDTHTCSTCAVGVFSGASTTQPQQAALRADIDTFTFATQIQSASLQFEIQGVSPQQWEQQPWLLAVTQRAQCTQVSPTGEAQAEPAEGYQLPRQFRPISQFEEPTIGARICSPTCVAMLLAADAQSSAPLGKVAKLAYCKQHDLYGVWPYALYAASRFGKLGLLAYFGSWQQAQAVLQRDLPIVASIRYGRGELSDAALERERAEPAGHLVLIRGYTQSEVQVLDPAAKDPTQVARSYRLEELKRIWLERSGMGYVFL